MARKKDAAPGGGAVNSIFSRLYGPRRKPLTDGKQDEEDKGKEKEISTRDRALNFVAHMRRPSKDGKGFDDALAPLEHPAEPVELDLPLKCPSPEPSIADVRRQIAPSPPDGSCQTNWQSDGDFGSAGAFTESEYILDRLRYIVCMIVASW
eukprot:SM002158S06658  [mRNA]  locus=s2158:835:1782:- [translate_table: standard]